MSGRSGGLWATYVSRGRTVTFEFGEVRGLEGSTIVVLGPEGRERTCSGQSFPRGTGSTHALGRGRDSGCPGGVPRWGSCDEDACEDRVLVLFGHRVSDRRGVLTGDGETREARVSVGPER